MKLSTRFIKFIGGSNLLFSLIILILIGVVFFIFNKVSFVFHPLIVIVSTVAPPVVLAFIAYYLINPIINLLEKLHIKRLWGIIIIILALLGAIAGLAFLVVPSIEKQIDDLVTDTPAYAQQFGNKIQSLVANSFLEPYYNDAYQWVASNLSSLPDKISSSLGGFYEGIKRFASTITNVIIALATFPFVLFFLLKDNIAFKNYFLHLLPPKFRDDAEKILKNMDVQVGSYIRGQLIVAGCIGILLYIGYLIIGLEYAITLAVIAAVTNVVPYIGPVVAISPAVVIAIIDSPFMILKLAIVWAVVQFSEGHFISPNVMGHTMRVHPLTIMFVLLVGGNLFGVVGIILGIPGYAIVKVLVQFIFGKFKQRYNKYYADDAGVYEEKHYDKK